MKREAGLRGDLEGELVPPLLPLELLVLERLARGEVSLLGLGLGLGLGLELMICGMTGALLDF